MGIQLGMAQGGPQTEHRTDVQEETDRLVPWNVVLLDDQEHSYEYVVKMMQTLFRHPLERAFTVAQAVDSQGRAICLTTHKELAELKRDQILGFGADPMIISCKGSMSAIIEPAEFDGDDDEDED